MAAELKTAATVRDETIARGVQILAAKIAPLINDAISAGTASCTLRTQTDHGKCVLDAFVRYMQDPARGYTAMWHCSQLAFVSTWIVTVSWDITSRQ